MAKRACDRRHNLVEKEEDVAPEVLLAIFAIR
jgi:hypothetical protein